MTYSCMCLGREASETEGFQQYPIRSAVCAVWAMGVAGRAQRVCLLTLLAEHALQVEQHPLVKAESEFLVILCLS